MEFDRRTVLKGAAVSAALVTPVAAAEALQASVQPARIHDAA